MDASTLTKRSNTIELTSAEQQTGALSGDLMTVYNLFYTKSMLNVTIHRGDKDSPVMYYCQSKIMKQKPYFYIRRGSESGAIVSSVVVPWMGKTMSIGLGDGTEDGQTQVTRDRMRLRQSDYHFGYEENTFDWVKDRSKQCATAYECVDENGKVYASLLSGGGFNWSKAGELYLRNNISQELEFLLLASGLGIWTMEGANGQSFFKAYS